MFESRPMGHFTPATTVDPTALERQFEQVRRQGFAVSTGEYDVGVSTVAVVVSLRGEPFGSLSLGGHEAMLDDVPKLVRFLDPARRELERILAGRRR